MRERSLALKSFLMDKLYRHPQVVSQRTLAQQVVQELFSLYCERPREMQAGYAARVMRTGLANNSLSCSLHRVVADYIAGMTDRFAMREHQRMTGATLFDMR
jgi:dGTPase